MECKIEITKDTMITDVLRECPQCIEVLVKHNMPCRTCMGVSTATVEEGAIMHDVDLDFLLKELKMCCIHAEPSQD